MADVKDPKIAEGTSRSRNDGYPRYSRGWDARLELIYYSLRESAGS